LASSSIIIISAGIESAVAQATGWSNVYQGQQITLDWGDFIAKFKDANDDICGATISWGGFAEEAMDTMENELEHGFVIRCLYGCGEDTERIFRQKVEQICEILRDHPTGATSYERIHSVSFTAFETRQIGSVLCHYTEIRFNLTERVARNQMAPSWTQLTIWHRFEAHAGAPGLGLFNVRADLVTDNDMTDASFRMEFPSWLPHAAFEAQMMVDPEVDGTDTLARTGRLWVDGSVGTVQSDIHLVGMKDARGIWSDDQDTGIDHQMSTSDTAWVQTVYTPANLAGTQSAASPPEPEGGSS